MTRIGYGWVLAAVLALAGCGVTGGGNGPAQARALVPGTLSEAQVAAAPRVTAFRVEVPASLRASEANTFYPFADLVWRGDPPGDRHAQVAALFEEAARRAIAADLGGREAVAVARVERFHGVTERTRFSVGGVYSIRFTLLFVDPETGEPLAPPRVIRADLPAPGGNAAVELDRQGQTEKVRVTDHLAWTLGQEFLRPLTP
ncbi:DUF6778 family protein [Rubellimicrobium sp. CFH 75288]|uniref:DUF6778 family protein n=1 Tax=Rubellimicrobium sp. CFH 75288 TaxID=2697034 RepID=UPI0014132135|nr:DUF6778 family protein [Rubellimicrobium sp. CFH 75288]NAZ36089.1 hypothetical protein [Rubellimicrobium sp. CFH 75288]